jgi:hypothetical protein
MKVQCMGYVVTGAKKIYMYLLWYKVFIHFYLWLYWFNNLVKHLNFKNMSFTWLLIICHFMHVQATGKNH